MTNFTKLNLSNDLLLKLKEKNVQNFSDVEVKVFNLIANGSNVVLNNSTNITSYVLPLVKKLESTKKMKATRKPKLMVIVNDKEHCDQLINEFKSLLTKELVIVSCVAQISMKKNKKKFGGPTDIIVGTTDRLNDLIDAVAFKTKSIKTVCVLGLEKINNTELDTIMSKLRKEDANTSTVSDSVENENFQLIVIASDIDMKLKSLMEKFTGSSYETLVSDEEESDSDRNDDDESGSESDEDKIDVPMKINGNKEKNNENNDSEEDNSSDSNEKNQCEIINNDLINRVKMVDNAELHNKTAKLLIEEFGELETVSRLIQLICAGDQSKSTDTGDKSKSTDTGNKSKLTGRKGYTAYHFTTNVEVNSKGYLFKSLKRLIDEELVEKIERVQQRKDLKGFVFDLASENDEAFQENWRDGKFDTLELLEGDMPELMDAFDRGGGGAGGPRRGSERGGFFGARGNSRGGPRGGRWIDRGGRGGRGRMNDRGGKRPFAPQEGVTNSKVVKFD